MGSWVLHSSFQPRSSSFALSTFYSTCWAWGPFPGLPKLLLSLLDTLLSEFNHWLPPLLSPPDQDCLKDRACPVLVLWSQSDSAMTSLGGSVQATHPRWAPVPSPACKVAVAALNILPCLDILWLCQSALLTEYLNSISECVSSLVEAPRWHLPLPSAWHNSCSPHI